MKAKDIMVGETYAATEYVGDTAASRWDGN